MFYSMIYWMWQVAGTVYLNLIPTSILISKTWLKSGSSSSPTGKKWQNKMGDW